MKNKIYKNIIILLLITFFHQNLSADMPRYIDFKLILNQSEAGKKAQLFLKNKLDKGIKELNTSEKSLIEEEKNLIKQKKVITTEEYRSKLDTLRKKVSQLRKKRNKLLESVAKDRSKARNELLKNLNPIISDYMKTNKIRMVLDKKSLLLADENLDITKDILNELNKKLKSIKLN